MNITFNDLLNMMRREGQAFILPYFENQIVSSNDKPSSILDTSKSAIFHKNKMIGNLDKPATEGIRWFIDNRFDSIKTVELKDMEEPVSFQVNHRKAKLTPKIENGEWSIKVDIAARSVIIMNNTNLALMNPKLLEKINEGLRDRIRKEIESSLLQAQHKLKLDVFGFAQAFNRKYPKQWEKNKRNWQELLPKVKVTLNIQSTISRTGLKTVPIAIPEEEVQQK
jgi:spore germination protein KC